MWSVGIRDNGMNTFSTEVRMCRDVDLNQSIFKGFPTVS